MILELNAGIAERIPLSCGKVSVRANYERGCISLNSTI